MEHEPQGNILKALALAALLAAVSVAAAEFTGFGIFDAADDAEITAKLEAHAQARKSFRPCDITITQYGPGERWYSSSKLPQCASAAGTVPNHILSFPLEDQ